MTPNQKRVAILAALVLGLVAVPQAATGVDGSPDPLPVNPTSVPFDASESTASSPEPSLSPTTPTSEPTPPDSPDDPTSEVSGPETARNAEKSVGEATEAPPPFAATSAQVDEPPQQVTLFGADGFYRVPYGSDIFEVTSGIALLVSPEEWEAAGSPPLTDASVSYEKYAWSPTLYAVIAWSTASVTVTALSWSQWSTAGFPAPTVVPHITTTGYLQIVGEAMIYQVGPSSELHALTYAEWTRAGSPAPLSTGALPGSSYHLWPTSNTVFSVDPLGQTRAMSWDHWRLVGFPEPVRLTNQGIYKWAWDPTVVHYTDLVGGSGRALTWEQWRGMAFPGPRVVTRMPGEALRKYWGDATIYYSAPGLGTKALSYAQWAEMGYPAPAMVNPPFLVYGTLRSGQPAHYLIGNDTYREVLGRAPVHDLYNAGTFPYAVPNALNTVGVVAESMWVNDAVYGTVVARLDRYEHYDPNLPIDRQAYMRVLRTFADPAGGTADGYMYVATPRQAAYARANLTWIASGDWLRR